MIELSIFDKFNDTYTSNIVRAKYRNSNGELDNVFEMYYKFNTDEDPTGTGQLIKVWPNKPRFIDLGLPSKTLWCDRNFYLPNNDAIYDQFNYRSSGYKWERPSSIPGYENYSPNSDMTKDYLVYPRRSHSEILFPFSYGNIPQDNKYNDISGSKYDGIYSLYYLNDSENIQNHLTTFAINGFECENENIPKDSYLRTPTYSQYVELSEYCNVTTKTVTVKFEYEDIDANYPFANNIDQNVDVTIYKYTSKVNGESILFYGLNLFMGQFHEDAEMTTDPLNLSGTRSGLILSVFGTALYYTICDIITSLFSDNHPNGAPSLDDWITRRNAIYNKVDEYDRDEFVINYRYRDTDAPILNTSTPGMKDNGYFGTKRDRIPITGIKTNVDVIVDDYVLNRNGFVDGGVSGYTVEAAGRASTDIDTINVVPDVTIDGSVKNTNFVYKLNGTKTQKPSLSPKSYDATTNYYLRFNTASDNQSSNAIPIVHPIRPVISKNIPVIRYIDTILKCGGKRTFELYIYQSEPNIHNEVNGTNPGTITEIGMCYNNTKVARPSIENSHTYVMSSFGYNKNYMNVEFPNVGNYNVRFYAKHSNGSIIYTETVLVEVDDLTENAVNGIEFVDLGDGLLWSKYNLGSTEDVREHIVESIKNQSGATLSESEIKMMLQMVPVDITSILSQGNYYSKKNNKWCIWNLRGYRIPLSDNSPATQNFDIQGSDFDNVTFDKHYPWTTPNMNQIASLMNNDNFFVSIRSGIYTYPNNDNEVFKVKALDIVSRSTLQRLILPSSSIWKEGVNGFKENNVESCYWTSSPKENSSKFAHRFRFEIKDGDSHDAFADEFTSNGNPFTEDNRYGMSDIHNHYDIRPVMEKNIIDDSNFAVLSM